MDRSDKFYKENPSDAIWWLDTSESDGLFVFSFDKVETFNLFADYPHKLTPDQKRIFDKENPHCANYFKDRVTS